MNKLWLSLKVAVVMVFVCTVSACVAIDEATSASVSQLTGIDGSRVFIRGRKVDIAVKWASDHEVTQSEYEKYCVYGGNYKPSGDYVGKGVNKYPAYYVSWYDAIVYCNKRSIAEGFVPCYRLKGSTNPDDWGAIPSHSWEAEGSWDEVTCDFAANGYRLPTEAEWEYLARGGNLTNSGQTKYSGSNTIDDVAWFSENSDKIQKVQKKAANALGLYDMSGNIAEWCWDWYSETITMTTPSTGPSSGSLRVFRGGGWYSVPSNCTVAIRDDGYSPTDRSIYRGFRVVRSAL